MPCGARYSRISASSVSVRFSAGTVTTAMAYAPVKCFAVAAVKLRRQLAAALGRATDNLEQKFKYFDMPPGVGQITTPSVQPMSRDQESIAQRPFGVQ